MNKVYLGFIVILASVTLGLGQIQKPKKTAPFGDDAGKSKQTTLVTGTNISAELQKTVDVNNARVGDQVFLKTTQSIRHDGQIVVPKGATLIGRVTDVQRRTKNNAQSKLSMVFDQIKGRELTMPLSATVVSVTNAAARVSTDDSFMSEASGSSSTTGSTSRRSAGGGLLGGVSGTVGGLVGTTTQTVGSVANTAGNTLGTTTGTVGRTVNGLTFSTGAGGSANAATTISSHDKNLRFEKGATFNLRVAN
jgi:hypothetical protein